MKKVLLTAGFAVFMALALSAQTKEAPPPPPTPPATSEPSEPPPPPPSPDKDDHDEFLKRNSCVKSLSWTEKNELIVRLKSGKEEKYNLADDKSVKEAESKYGKLPAAPPPPPLPPPAPPPPPKPPKKTQS